MKHIFIILSMLFSSAVQADSTYAHAGIVTDYDLQSPYIEIDNRHYLIATGAIIHQTNDKRASMAALMPGQLLKFNVVESIEDLPQITEIVIVSGPAT